MYPNSASNRLGLQRSSALDFALARNQRSKPVNLDSNKLSAIGDCIRNLIRIDTQERLDATKRMIKEDFVRQKQELEQRLAKNDHESSSSGPPVRRRQSRFLKRRTTAEPVIQEEDADVVDTVAAIVEIEKSPSTDQGFESGLDLSETDDPPSVAKDDSALENLDSDESSKLSAIPEEIVDSTIAGQQKIDQHVDVVNIDPVISSSLTLDEHSDMKPVFIETSVHMEVNTQLNQDHDQGITKSLISESVDQPSAEKSHSHPEGHEMQEVHSEMSPITKNEASMLQTDVKLDDRKQAIQLNEHPLPICINEPQKADNIKKPVIVQKTMAFRNVQKPVNATVVCHDKKPMNQASKLHVKSVPQQKRPSVPKPEPEKKPMDRKPVKKPIEASKVESKSSTDIAKKAKEPTPRSEAKQKAATVSRQKPPVAMAVVKDARPKPVAKLDEKAKEIKTVTKPPLKDAVQSRSPPEKIVNIKLVQKTPVKSSVQNEKSSHDISKLKKKPSACDHAKKPPIQNASANKKLESKSGLHSAGVHSAIASRISRSRSKDRLVPIQKSASASGRVAAQPPQHRTPRLITSPRMTAANQEKAKFIHRKTPPRLITVASENQPSEKPVLLRPVSKSPCTRKKTSSDTAPTVVLRPVSGQHPAQTYQRSQTVDVGALIRRLNGARKWVPKWRRREEEGEEEEAEAEEAPSQSEAVEESAAHETSPQKEEEKPKPKPPPPRQIEAEGGQAKSEAELAMLAQKRKHEEEEEAKLAHYEEQRRIQREKEEEELRQLKEKQERRKREREEEELLLAERKAMEEERRRQEDEERKAKAEADRQRKDEEKRKRQALMAGLQASGGPNFEITKKDKQAEKFDKFGNIVKAKAEMGMTKEQHEEQKKRALAEICKPLETSGLDVAALRTKIKEMHARISRLEGEKYDMEKRRDRQEYDLKELNERQRQISRNKALKKGLNPEEAANSPHPPKVPVASKYDRQIDRRSYHDRYSMFEAPPKPPKPKVFHGSARPPSEWGRKESEELENLRKNLEPPKYQEAVKIEGAKPPVPIVPVSIEGDDEPEEE